MSRWQSALNESAAAQTRVVMVTMVHLAIPNDEIYAHDGIGTIRFQDQDWLGVGKYGAIETVSESTEIVAAPVTLTLSGVDASLIQDAMTAPYHGEAAQVYLALFNADTDALVDEPELVWDGLMDVLTIELGEQSASIKVQCEHRLRRMPSASRYTDEDQQALYAGDAFFNQVHNIPQYRSRWGDKTGTFAQMFAGPAGQALIRVITRQLGR